MKTTLATFLAAFALATRTHKNEDGTINEERTAVRVPPGEAGEALFSMIVCSFAVPEAVMVRGFSYLWLSFPTTALGSCAINILSAQESANKIAGVETPPSKPQGLALAPVLWDDSDQEEPLKN